MVEDLEGILAQICNDARTYGVPLCHLKLELYLWLDTRKDTLQPIVGRVEIDFKESLNESQCLEFIRAINFVTLISMIITCNPYKLYHVTKVEEFMKKPCAGCR